MGTGTGSIDLSTLNNLHTNLTQHFWFNSNTGAAYGTGVHMTLSSQAEFIANPTGQNILMNTDGISIRNGTVPLMVLDNDSLDFNVVVDLEQGTYSNVASFGAVSIIGTDGAYRSILGGGTFNIVNGDDVTIFGVQPSGNPSAEDYIFSENNVRIQDTYTISNALVSGTPLYADCFSRVFIGGKRHNIWKTLTFTVGVSGTKSYTDSGMTTTVSYTAPNTLSITKSNTQGYAEIQTIRYTQYSEVVDRGTLTFGSRVDDGFGNGSATFGSNLTSVYDSQTVVGRYNKSVDGAFIVGNGSKNNESNALSVLWNGDFYLGDMLFNRTRAYDCKAFFIAEGTYTSAQQLLHAYVALCGRICNVVLNFRNTESIDPGQNFIYGIFGGYYLYGTALPAPRFGAIGIGYYGRNALIGHITEQGKRIVIRNASANALIIGGSNSAIVQFSYIIADDITQTFPT